MWGLSSPSKSFNPRAHVGRDCARHGLHVEATVSIHAPTWGATEGYYSKYPEEKEVSIHAPTWGATKELPIQMWADEGFNPRAHVGRDRKKPS